MESDSKIHKTRKGIRRGKLGIQTQVDQSLTKGTDRDRQTDGLSPIYYLDTSPTNHFRNSRGVDADCHLCTQFELSTYSAKGFFT